MGGWGGIYGIGGETVSSSTEIVACKLVYWLPGTCTGYSFSDKIAQGYFHPSPF